MPDALLSPHQVAELAGLSTRAIYRVIERGELRATRLCKRYRIAPADLEDWIERNAVRAPVKAPADTATATPRRSTGRLRSLVDGERAA